MNDLEYTIRKICERRGVTLSKVESLAFNMRVAFGLANGTYLLPVDASAFYFIATLSIRTDATGKPVLVVLPSAGPSAGNLNIECNTPTDMQGIEANSLQYIVTTHSAGAFYLYGTVFKITYV